MSRAELTGYEPVLCTTDEKSDDALAAHVAEAGFRVVRGNSTNKIARWFTAAQELDREVIHSLDADDPYFDFDEVRDSISNLWRMDLQLVHTSHQSDRGMASVGTTFARRYLRELDKRARMLVHSDLDVSRGAV